MLQGAVLDVSDGFHFFAGGCKHFVVPAHEIGHGVAVGCCDDVDGGEHFALQGGRGDGWHVGHGG